MHLTQPDPEDFFKGSSEEVKMRQELQKMELIKSDAVLKKRFIDIAKEAVAYGILEGA